MIRPAAFADLAKLYELVSLMHERSTFNERGIHYSPQLVRSVLMDGVRKNGGQFAGSTLLNVVEFRGKVEGFMLGLLQPVYGIGLDFEAQDIFLFCTPQAPKIGTGLLIDAYLKWAQDNPRVVDIMLSWTDVAGVDGTKLARLYGRKGFAKRGEMFVRRVR